MTLQNNSYAFYKCLDWELSPALQIRTNKNKAGLEMLQSKNIIQHLQKKKTKKNMVTKNDI